jgi:excisionase family DNA binding protein
MLAKKPNLTRNEIARAFEGDLAAKFPPILSPAQLAELLGLSIKTIYLWIADGRLDGVFRKRGKHCLIWRDGALDKLFNDKPWKNQCMEPMTKKTESPSGNA